MQGKVKILLELPTWLGDSIMTTPAIENLLDSNKLIELSVIGNPNVISLFNKHPRIHKRIVLRKKYHLLFFQALTLEKYDFFISFRSSLRSKFMSFLVRSNKKFLYKKNKFNFGHQVERYNNFINEIFKKKSTPGNLLISGYSSIHKEEKVIGLNPGASYGSAKRWYPEKFAELIELLGQHYHFKIFGGGNEIAISDDIEKILLEKKILNYSNLAGKTSMEDLVSEIASLDFFITGDSGPMHIAAAFDIPTISIFGPTHVTETCQWKNDKSVIIKKNLDCQPCMKRVCPLKHHRCMKDISAKEVYNAFKEIQSS